MKEILLTILGIFIIAFVSMIATYTLAVLVRAIIKEFKNNGGRKWIKQF